MGIERIGTKVGGISCRTKGGAIAVNGRYQLHDDGNGIKERKRVEWSKKSMAPSAPVLQHLLKEHDFPLPSSSNTLNLKDFGGCDYFQLQPEGHYVYQLPGHPRQAYIDGEHWSPIFKPACIKGSKNLLLRDDDVFVCTYPKCGTTWIQHICAQLMNDSYGPEAGNELSRTSPMIERMGPDYIGKLKSPRLLKTHYDWRNLPKGSKAKYIYCVRNPKDCLTSYYFHNQNFKIYNYEFGTFDNFFEWFMSDKIAFGNYYWHLLSWLPHINDQNVLFLRYEDMWADLRTAVKKIGHFLGGKAAEIVDNNDQLEKVVNESKIDSMKKDQSRWFPADNLRGKPFIRKGGSRDWKNYFSKEQSDRMDREWQVQVSGTIAENWWKAEMSWDELEPDDGIEADFDSPRSFLSKSNLAFTAKELESMRKYSFQWDLNEATVTSRHHLSSLSAESGYSSNDEI
uniref:Sulfotransfer_1 domain-containing protein n=1 Tax=Syphacia muris TaxID=451379 RepID=A0A0N5AC08_9BILA